MPKVTVISPVFGVERFIKRSVESMMIQTLDDVEFIFVNDCTKDRSIDILKSVIKRYPHRESQVRVINHEINRGLPSARNTGLSAATGDFIFHWDSDDYAEPDMLERMYNHTVYYESDIVWTDWFLNLSASQRYMSQPNYDNPISALKGMLGGAMKYNVWNKLAKRSLYLEHEVRFPDGFGMGEDMTMMLLFAHAKKVTYLPNAFYHYIRTNNNAISLGIDKKNFIPLKRNVLWIADELKKRTDVDLRKEISFLKLESKYPLLVTSGDIKMYKIWKLWFPEANRYILENTNVSVRSRIIQLLASSRQYWAVWLHYKIVCSFIYSLIYK